MNLGKPNYRANIERAMIFCSAAFDWNCPQHISPCYKIVEIRAYQRIEKLEAKIKSLRNDGGSN